MYKIYVQNKPLFLTDKIDKTIDEYRHRPDTIFIDELSTSAVKTMFQQLETDSFYAGVYLHPNLPELISTIKSHLQLIIAAGGFVHTDMNNVLLIFRKGKWDLPKGKLDEGEELKSCALREIREETGAEFLSLEEPLTITYHTYYEKEKRILKESHWFLIRAKEKTVLIPQTQEDIEECRWVNLAEMEFYFNNMHASIVDVVKAGIEMLSKKTS